jgi:hypothetical protein
VSLYIQKGFKGLTSVAYPIKCFWSKLTDYFLEARSLYYYSMSQKRASLKRLSKFTFTPQTSLQDNLQSSIT